MMGDYFVDATQAYLHGMPPTAYVRDDPMSDRLNALLFCPWYLVRKAVSQLELHRGARVAAGVEVSSGLSTGPGIIGSGCCALGLAWSSFVQLDSDLLPGAMPD